jgi:hypothetical protein
MRVPIKVIKDLLPRPQSELFPRLDYRKFLFDKVRREERRKRLLVDRQPNQGTPSVCTVVFEILQDDLEEDLVEMFSWSTFLSISHRISTTDVDGTLWVAHDRTYPCTSSSPSVIAFLQLTPYPSSAAFWYRNHSVRILPVHGRNNQSPISRLPLSILRRIISEVLLNTGGRWLSALLSYGLICRSWAHLLDFFYTIHTVSPVQSGWREKPKLKAMARSLYSHPEKAKLITSFSPYNYDKSIPGPADPRDLSYEESVERCQYILDILELTRDVKCVCIDLDQFRTSFLPQLLRKLYKLRKIEQFRVIAYRKLSVANVQAIVAEWPNLVDLAIEWCIQQEPEAEELRSAIHTIPIFSPTARSSSRN